MSNQLAQRISFRGLMKFTLPTILMMILTSLYTIVDGIFVSRLINTDALSAVNIVFPLVSLAIGIGTMFGSGASAIIARKNGEGKNKEANENFTFIMLFSLILAIVMAILVFIFLKPIINMLGSNEEIYGYCYDYAMAWNFFLPACVLQLQFQTAMVANGKPALGLVVSLIGGISNMILDYLLIHTFDMGISGAAVATGIGYSVQVVFGLIYFGINNKGILRFVKPKKDWKVVLNSIINGSSEMVSNLSTCVTTLLFNLIMMRFLGQDGVAAITIVLYIDFLLVAVSLGYSMGVAPLISYNYGAGDKIRLQKIFKISTLFILGFSILVTVATVIFKEPLVLTFAKRGTAVYDFAVHGMLIFSISYLFKGINIFASALFTAFSNGLISAVLSFARTMGFTVLCILGLTAIWGVNGLWLAVPIAEMLTIALTILFIMKYKRVYNYI